MLKTNLKNRHFYNPYALDEVIGHEMQAICQYHRDSRQNQIGTTNLRIWPFKERVLQLSLFMFNTENSTQSQLASLPQCPGRVCYHSELIGRETAVPGM